MPPTIGDENQPLHSSGSSSHGPSASRKDRRSHADKRLDYYCCRVKYNNTLPDIPFDPKFIAYPFDINRYVQYKPTSLEKSFKSELLTEHDLGIPIELIDASLYRTAPLPPGAVPSLDSGDERLLEEETSTPQNSRRSVQHARNISWLRRTEYISSELGRYGLSNDKAEIKIGAQIKKLMKEEDLYRDRESQIAAIEKTFDDVKHPIDKHHSKPNIHKVAEYPVFPDFKLWAHPYAQVIFDADPAPPRNDPVLIDDPSTNTEAEINDQITDIMSHAMIRGMMDESGDQFVAYFLPQAETRRTLNDPEAAATRKRKLEEATDESELPDDQFFYKLTREYGWTVKNKASKGYEENYFFIFRPEDDGNGGQGGGVFYNELETRVRLNKRRKAGQLVQLTNSVLVVKHRPFNDNERNAQEVRMTQLEPAMPEDEDEEEEEEGQEGEAMEGQEGEGEGAEEGDEEGEREGEGEEEAEKGGNSSDEANEADGDGQGTPAASEDENEEPPKKSPKKVKKELESSSEEEAESSGGEEAPKGDVEENSQDDDSDEEQSD